MIALRHDAQQLFKQLNGAKTSHSVASHNVGNLQNYRARVGGKKDVRTQLSFCTLLLHLCNADAAEFSVVALRR